MVKSFSCINRTGNTDFMHVVISRNSSIQGQDEQPDTYQIHNYHEKN